MGSGKVVTRRCPLDVWGGIRRLAGASLKLMTVFLGTLQFKHLVTFETQQLSSFH